MSFIIAIDGPAGSGKSTISKILAKKNNLIFISSGQLYRVCSWFYLKNEYKQVDDNLLNEINKLNITYENNSFLVNNKNIENELITNEVSMQASNLAINIKIREFVNSKINEIFKHKDIIMDGRDIGTKVFPNANLKIFLTASLLERAKRRQKELKQKNNTKYSLLKIYMDIKKRDKQDKKREIAPLVKAKDAIVIKTTNKSIEDIEKKIQKIIDEKR